MTSEFREKIMDIACQIADEFDRQEKDIEHLYEELSKEKKKNKEFLASMICLMENQISEN